MKRKQDQSPIGKLAKEEHDAREGHRRSKDRLRKRQTPRAHERGQDMDQLLSNVQPLTPSDTKAIKTAGNVIDLMAALKESLKKPAAANTPSGEEKHG